ncbi:MAG: GFA family protein [Vulcanimicrobiota bacterium]
MTLYRGGCHCGQLAVSFETAIPAAQLRLRQCACRFCRLHGAVTATDPSGRVSFEGGPRRYRFGLATADFLLCPQCGVYLGALLSAEEGQFATLNINTLHQTEAFGQPPAPTEYGDETRENRIARRIRLWTPARVD